MSLPEGLTIIIPTYNEAANMNELLRRISESMGNAGISYEIIIVDDHSTDATVKVARLWAKRASVQVYKKTGKPGKGYSILEGATHASYAHIAMLDADLQYPPEILPSLYEKAKRTGIGVARRKTYKSSLLRIVASRVNAFIFGRLLLDLDTDVQSGCKIFPYEVFTHLENDLVTAWAVDIPLLYTAYELGYTASHVNIDFNPREHGTSNVRFLTTAWQIGIGAVKTRLSKRIRALDNGLIGTMNGAGVAYKRKRFITHTTLPHYLSAMVSLTFWQKTVIAGLIALLLFGIATSAFQTAIVFTTIISSIYFIDVFFNLFIIMKSLHQPPEMTVGLDELHATPDTELPMYTILCPLYKEAAVLPQFVESMNAMDWPKEKLDILLLLEADDKESIEMAQRMNLPEQYRILIVPDSQPKTKPKACNFGLSYAQGEYIVVYDAEDKPDPYQLKKAYLAFRHAKANIVCMQAKLNYYNPHDNLLTRLFTAEYSLWFDVVLPGLQSIQTTIPLGGTSNHFRTKQLLELHGWDPFNVTEDADLGARLFTHGYKTAIIDSTTLEEANSSVKNWFRQRSRWIKGYIQTYFVHFRDPITFAKKYGKHALLFQLIVGGKIAFMLINPLLWAITISYFALYEIVGPTIESIYPAPVFYMAVISLVFGNFIYLYNYMIGVAKRGQWELIRYVFLIPAYWIMISVSAGIALVQFFVKPYYWEKTIHGLHLGKANKQTKKALLDLRVVRARVQYVQRLADLVQTKLLGNIVLIGSSLSANIFNFLYNSYLGRKATFEDFGLISLIGSFLYITQVPMGALSRAMTHKSAYLLGQYDTPITEFWKLIRRKSYLLSFIAAVLWLALIPILMSFFHTPSPWPFLLFTPVWIIGTLSAVDGGFLSGNLMFISLAVAAILEPFIKLTLAVLFVETGFHTLVFASIPLSMLASFGVTYFFASKIKQAPSAVTVHHPSMNFPWKFYWTSVLTALSNITYLSLDVILAKHYLSPAAAGQYSFLSLAGKMIYFLGSLVSTFLVPYVSRELGAKRPPHRVFRVILRIAIISNLAAYGIFGAAGFLTVPFLWGQKTVAIVPLLPLYGIAMVTYSVASLIITYHQLQGKIAFPVIGFLLGLLQIIGAFLFHGSIEELTWVVGMAGVITLATVMFFHKYYDQSTIVYRNIVDFFGLFRSLPVPSTLEKGKHRILIFNWRDVRHLWSGGAEVYIHELAKRWVADGNQVTLFCGNDGKSSRYETIDGVDIIRRGGFYTVYLWACLYYRIRLRGKYDIIIDSENGLPFFTPLYAKEKTFLLIHHVHQEVFRKSLIPPFSWIALLLEKRVMPVVYRKTEVMTVSPSSKTDILRHKLTAKEPYVVYNGIDLTLCKPGKKSRTPLVLYLGRLTTAKSLPVFIRTAAKIHATLPKVKFVIAGEGPERTALTHLVKKMKLEQVISFKGKVSEAEKISLFQQAWVFVNPSLIEGWGITTIEANACGTPVVASNVAGLRDAVDNPHSGFLVPYGDIDAFADSITKLLTSTTVRSRMAREARVWAEKFSWDKSAQKGLSLFYHEKN